MISFRIQVIYAVFLWFRTSVLERSWLSLEKLPTSCHAVFESMLTWVSFIQKGWMENLSFTSKIGISYYHIFILAVLKWNFHSRDGPEFCGIMRWQACVSDYVWSWMYVFIERDPMFTVISELRLDDNRGRRTYYSYAPSPPLPQVCHVSILPWMLTETLLSASCNVEWTAL